MIQTLILDVEHAVAVGTPAQRAVMLRRITALFTDHASGLSETGIEPFDAIILHLARNVEVAARSALAQEIADIANAPRGVVRDLAFDPEITVAGPILTRSLRVAEDDLVRIVGQAGPLHLDAVSRRRTLSERITDVLVTRAATAAVRRIAGNEAAHLSVTGFDALVDLARRDNVLRALLDLRSSVPEASRIIITPTLAPPIQASAPQGSVDMEEKAIVALIGEGRVEDALSAIARIAGVPKEMALQAHRGRDLDPLLFLLRGADLGWGTLKHLIQARPGRRMLPEDMRAAFEAFQALSVATARRSVRLDASKFGAGNARVA